tara:strand:+ start:797 stop:2440 length:1644 start_codon:yes stop_codon:yes gene_type:complete
MAKIPGTGVVAKQSQKAVQKLFNIGGKEVMENVSKQTPELFNTLSDMNKSGIVKAVDSNLHSSDSVIKAATNKDFSTITDIANDGNSKALVDQTNQQYADWVHPPRSQDEIRQELESFVSESKAKYLANPIDAEMQTVKGMQPTQLSGASQEELLPQIQQYINLRQELNPNDPMPKKGWQELFGNVLDEEGYPMRVDGGRKESKNPLSFTTTKSGVKRKINEGLYTKIEDSDRIKAITGQGLDKHHVTHIQQTEPFGWHVDGRRRSPEDMELIESILRRDGIELANKDFNEMYLTQAGHRGTSGLKGDTAVHKTLSKLTDLQGFKNYQTEAREILYEFPAISGGKNKRYKWIKNTPILNAENELVSSKLQSGRMNMKGAKPIRFRMPGSKGTYIKGQNHGFSMELLDTISRIEDPEEVAAAIKLFLKDSGAGPAMEGAAALAFQAVDKGISEDEITKLLARKYNPQMIEFAEQLQKLPEYADNPVLQAVIDMNKPVDGFTPNPVWGMTPLDKENAIKDVIANMKRTGYSTSGFGGQVGGDLQRIMND